MIIRLDIEAKLNNKGELVAATGGLKELEKGLKEVEKSAKPAKEAVTAFGAAQKEVQGQAEKMAGQLGAVGRVLTALGPSGLVAAAGIAAVGAAYAAVITTAATWTKNMVDQSGALTDLASQVGISTTALQEYAYVGAAVGVSQETIANAVGVASKRIAEGGDQTAAALKAIGLSMDELAGQSPEDQFTQIAAALKEVSDTGRQAALSADIFGRNSGILKVVRADYVGLADDARRLGTVMSETAVAAGDDLGDALTSLGLTWKGVQNTIAAQIVQTPGVVDGFRELAETLALLTSAAGDGKTALGELFEMFTGVSIEQSVKDLRDFVSLWQELHEMGGGKKVELSLPTVRGASKTPIPTMDAKALAIQREGIKLANELAKADEKVGRAAEKAARDSAAEFKKLEAEMSRISQRGEEGLIKSWLEADREAMNDWLDDMEQMQAELADMNALGNSKALEAPVQSMDEGIEEIIANYERFMDESEKLLEEGDRATAEAAQRFRDNFSALAGSFAQLADSLGGVWGGIANGASGVLNIFGQWGSAIDSATGKVNKMQVASNAVGTAADIYSTSKEDPSAASRMGKGALKGAAMGASTGQWYAVVIGAVAGAFIGYFSGPKWESAATQAASTFGAEVSKELSKAIYAASQKFKIDEGSAALLFIPQAMDELGMSADQAAPLVNQLMGEIVAGTVPAKQGLESVGVAFSKMAAEAEKSGEIGSDAMVSMINQARNLGLKVPEIQAYVSEQLSKATEGVSAGVTGIQMVTPEDATAQATIAGVTFWAVFKEKGLIAAGDAFKDISEKLLENIAKVGGDTSAAQGILGPIQDIVNLSGNEMFRGAAEGAQGFADTLTGLANSAIPMTTSQFSAFGQQANAAFEQAKAGGANAQQALMAIAPLLQALQQGSQAYGIELDANTQSLIQQGKDAGIAFKTDPMDRMVTVLEAIAKALGAELPTAATGAENALTGTGAAGTQMGDSIAGGSEAAKAALDGIAPAGDAAAAGLTAGFDAAAKSVADSITGMTEEGSSALGGMINDWQTLAGRGITVPVTFKPGDIPGGPPGSTPTDLPEEIPGFASGAYVPSKTLAWVAEDEPEYVIPKSKMKGGFGGTTLNLGGITINGTNLGPEEIGNALVVAVKNKLGSVAQLGLGR